MKHRVRRGFTIVELIIVIVVIAILATLTALLYSNAQRQARDTAIRDAADKFAQSIELMSSKINGGAIIKGGYGSTTAATSTGCIDGSGGEQAPGYGAQKSDANYKCTLGDAVVAAGYLSASYFTGLPPNVADGNSPVTNFITQKCSGDGKNYLFYSQEAPSSDSLAAVNNVLSTVCASQVSSVSGRNMGGVIQLDVR
ncbi:MAG TPA: prepilin-type N-terminal cleavage/methylation domain-containing protein [Candidatus Saccharimonadales bacterium]|nr:prepilin-type N-terminal cleavage/methylation domain-containing protein [Candidatus Saccharimonadales bacterium]